MGKPVALEHRTEYRYARPVSLGPQTIQLRPAPHTRTPILAYTLQLTPAEASLTWLFDPYANHIARAFFPNKTICFALEIHLLADLQPYNPFDFVLEATAQTYPFIYSPQLTRDLAPFRVPQAPQPRTRAFLAGIAATPQPTVSFLVALNGMIRDEVAYETRLEHGIQTPEQTLTRRRGSCRDSAWLLVAVLRHLGIAARFVSGYLVQLAPDEPAPDEPNQITKDTADLHAWTEVYLPGAGWIGLDPTSGLFTAEGHIPLVCTADAAEASPIDGTVEPAAVDFTYSMSVRRLDRAPTVAQPFTEEAWQEVRAVAHAIDRDLLANDVRLTMGGEPTFVGIDEPESLQWNLDALGPLKRTRALSLLRDLRAETAPGALLHFGQGKWYPGEALPRWAFHCISRLDGVPVWENVALIATEDQQLGFTAADALTFLQALTRRLQVSATDILPAFNPPDDPDDSPEISPDPAGYILPLRRRQPAGILAWSSQLWFPRPERLILSLGDSPIGYRIPIAELPWTPPDELVYEYEKTEYEKTEYEKTEYEKTEYEKTDYGQSSGEQRIKLPAAPARRPYLFAVEPTPDPLPPVSATAETATELIRPSLCVEVRDGRMHVFLPYVPVIADYLDLVAAVEDTCEHLRIPVWVEGYTPPADPRLRSFSLTPDPGVLEVNLPPTSNWDDLETLNTILFAQAHRNRLIAGKFAYDGTHLATGGGSHIVLGGASVPDSPILRRPGLLRSMVTFWQNHPSLSYLFSGMYVGPTSQYPRVDEARVDALYELELAFSQLPPEGCEPYILDGLFRNLLVDVTGNTHRAEFCIDKLYPPEGRGLRLGLLELRAFEMAPHPRMVLTQMLLVRALVLRLWTEPFTGSLIRWGTALHDRFMLPHFVAEDFAEVLDVIRRAGYPFEDAWFASHLEFRFPRIGSVSANGVEIELRQALEPWNVLAEETTSAGTGRSVDSSLERLQVKVTGLPAPGRYVVTCNGRRVPLGPTGQPGEAIAGIRYRARRLSAALHPTVPVHTPLTFDLLDTQADPGPTPGMTLGPTLGTTPATARRIARCTYFAAPPDGTVHTTRPATAAEARARRLERFVASSPLSEPASLPPREHNPAFPITLDLRFPAPAPAASGPGPDA